MSLAGLVGLTGGSGLSFFLRKRLPWIDPGNARFLMFKAPIICIFKIGPFPTSFSLF